jgi:hypothetical protein
MARTWLYIWTWMWYCSGVVVTWSWWCRKWIHSQSKGRGCEIGIGWGIEWVALKTGMVHAFLFLAKLNSFSMKIRSVWSFSLNAFGFNIRLPMEVKCYLKWKGPFPVIDDRAEEIRLIFDLKLWKVSWEEMFQFIFFLFPSSC